MFIIIVNGRTKNEQSDLSFNPGAINLMLMTSIETTLKRYLDTIKSTEGIRRILEQVKPIEDEEYLPSHVAGVG